MAINRKQLLAGQKHGLVHRISSHRLFRMMLERQRIDPRAAASGETERLLYRGLYCCAHCRAKDICRAWLAEDRSDANYVRFCPNSETIEALRIAGS